MAAPQRWHSHALSKTTTDGNGKNGEQALAALLGQAGAAAAKRQKKTAWNLGIVTTTTPDQYSERRLASELALAAAVLSCERSGGHPEPVSWRIPGNSIDIRTYGSPRTDRTGFEVDCMIPLRRMRLGW